MRKIVFRSRFASLAGAICTLLLLQACAGMASKEETIEKRANERWEAILGDDWVEAYEYLSPGYRSSVSLKQYQRTLLLAKVQWTGARFIESDCAETSCKVKISIDYTVFGAIPGVSSFNGTQEIEESWVEVKGKWYYVPNK